MILDFAVLARRDDWLGATLGKPFAQGPAVISFVGDEFGRGWHGGDNGLRDLAIMHISGGQEQDTGPPLVIADDVELGVTTAACLADTIGQGPPFPPPAQR